MVGRETYYKHLVSGLALPLINAELDVGGLGNFSLKVKKAGFYPVVLEHSRLDHSIRSVSTKSK